MKHKLLLVFFAIFLFIPWLGLKQLHSRGEAREALVAQSMNLSGNYILPQSYSDLVPSKPPMLHWLINLVAKLSGSLDEFAVRLPVALASIAFTFYFSSFLQNFGYKNYLIAPLILITSIQWFRHSNTARVDMLLSVGSVIAILEFYKWRVVKFCKDIPWLCLFGLIVAVYSKGPVGLVLPLAIFAIWSFVQKDSLGTIITRSLLVLAPAVVIGAIWYVLAYLQSGQAFIDKFWYENAQRLAGTMTDEPHKGTIIYLYTSILWSMLPWSLFWIWPAYTWIKSPNRFKNFTNSLYQNWSKSSFYQFLIIWIVVFLLFYSIPVSKRDVYLLPIMPAISILAANFIQKISLDRQVLIERLIKFLLVALIVLTVVLGSLTFLKPDVLGILSKTNQYSLLAIANYITVNYKLLAFVAIICILIYKLPDLVALDLEQKIINKIILQFGILLIIVQAIYAPSIGNSISYKNFADETKESIVSESRLYSYNDAFYGLSFYSQKKFYEVHAENKPYLEYGKYYLFENNLEDLQNNLKPGQCLRTSMRSAKPMVDPKRYVLMLEVYNCGS